MADKKISALTAATTPLAGTEVLPIVQSGSTVKVAVSNLTAGRTVSADALLVNTASSGGKVSIGGAGANRISFEAPSGKIYAGYDGATDAFQLASLSSIRLQTGSGYGLAVEVDASRNVNVQSGNVKLVTAGKGIDFSANGGDVLTQYDEGTWTPTGNGVTFSSASGKYTRIGNLVTCTFTAAFPVTADTSTAYISGLPFTPSVAGGVALGGYALDLVYAVTSGNTFIQPTNAAGSAFKTNANLSGQTIIGTFSFQV